MKLLTLLALAALMSCSGDPKKQLIQDHSETVGGVKTDLSFKLLELKPIMAFTNMDSMRILHENTLTDPFDSSKNLIDTMYHMYSNLVPIWQHRINECDSMMNIKRYASVRALAQIRYGDVKRKAEGHLADSQEKVEKYKPIKAKYDHYKEMGDKVLGQVYEATYTIKNPMLNNAKQTITKQYLFSVDETQILGTIPMEEK